MNRYPDHLAYPQNTPVARVCIQSSSSVAISSASIAVLAARGLVEKLNSRWHVRRGQRNAALDLLRDIDPIAFGRAA